MTALLIKLFALALALGQVTTRPDAVRTAFDPVRDRGEVALILRDGCAHMRKAFGIEDLDLDALIDTAMDDPQPGEGQAAAFRGIDFKQLHDAYLDYCTDRPAQRSGADLGEVIAFYNAAAADLPDAPALAGLNLPERTRILDGKGRPFAELFQPGNRRIVVPLASIPDHVQQAFIAAEDRRFYEHKGVDERGLIRAFIENLAQQRRVQGGSTITQQVAKNLLVGSDVTYERKIRELIVSSRMEHTLTKERILELYLNSIYLGRGAWGVEMAAQSYFGKPVVDLTLAEAALLAGLAKGPNYFAPDRNPDRMRGRIAYVLGRMKEDKFVTEAQAAAALARPWRLVAAERARRDRGFYLVDEVNREAARLAGIGSLTAEALDVRSSVDPDLQKAVEAALQEGLSRYEAGSGRTPRVAKPEANLTDAVERIEAARKSAPDKPAWRAALQAVVLPLYDVHWTPAVIVKRQAGDKSIVVGLGDGRMLPLDLGASSGQSLKRYDVVYVRAADGHGKPLVRAELRQRPSVQGAAVVLENKTGRVLAMTGGFSFPLSQVNRSTQSRRQPGSAFKPVVYLAALRGGLQPNTRIPDQPVTLPPIDAGMRAAHAGYWTPKNYDGGGGGTPTLRQAFEASRNVVTARLLSGGVARRAPDSLRDVCALAREAALYRSCVNYYPFVLGAQPLRMIDLAAFYASIANEGARVQPHVIDAIARHGETIFQHEPMAVEPSTFDRSAAYQLKTLLQGVVERGTARRMHALSPYVAGKTGTSNDENDAWFVGFTNDITIAVWVGYDNAEGRRVTLGAGNTGSKVAVPIFQDIVEAAWASGIPKQPLAAPSPEAARGLARLPIAFASGERLKAGESGGFMETFRLDAQGVLHDTRAAMTSKKDDESWRQHDAAIPARPDPDGAKDVRRKATPAVQADRDASDVPNREAVSQQPPDTEPAPPEFKATPRWLQEERARTAPPRVDPDYFWADRSTN
jgi:penicillin-binding protein 1A